MQNHRGHLTSFDVQNGFLRDLLIFLCQKGKIFWRDCRSKRGIWREFSNVYSK